MCSLPVMLLLLEQESCLSPGEEEGSLDQTPAACLVDTRSLFDSLHSKTTYTTSVIRTCRIASKAQIALLAKCSSHNIILY